MLSEETKNNEFVQNQTTEDAIVDIQLDTVKRKKFRINGDNSKMIELDVNDMDIVKRMRDIYPELNRLATEAITKLADVDEEGDTEQQVNRFADALTEIDKQMRENIDKLFDSNVSEICAPQGTMYALSNGKFRFEHIVEALAGLYETNLKEELSRVNARIEKHTNKYTKGKKK